MPFQIEIALLGVAMFVLGWFVAAGAVWMSLPNWPLSRVIPLAAVLLALSLGAATVAGNLGVPSGIASGLFVVPLLVVPALIRALELGAPLRLLALAVAAMTGALVAVGLAILSGSLPVIALTIAAVLLVSLPIRRVLRPHLP